MDEVNKIWTPKKKDQVPTQTLPKYFCLRGNLRKNAKSKGFQCTQPLRKDFFKPPQKFSPIEGGGGGLY
jgi:hypothetical protein